MVVDIVVGIGDITQSSPSPTKPMSHTQNPGEGKGGRGGERRKEERGRREKRGGEGRGGVG